MLRAKPAAYSHQLSAMRIQWYVRMHSTPTRYVQPIELGHAEVGPAGKPSAFVSLVHGLWIYGGLWKKETVRVCALQCNTATRQSQS